MEQKGFQQFLKEDPSLLEKITYKEFTEGKAATPKNDDVAIEKAYDSYCKKRAELEKI